MFGNTIDVTIDIVPHCASIPREQWGGEEDLRPLSEAGVQQASVLGEALGGEVDAVYSSPSLRCRQSVAPLAAAAGVSVVTMEGLREAHGFASPAAWVSGPFAPIGASIGGAWAAGRAASVLFSLASRHIDAHVALCSHGDTIPALLSYLAAAYDHPLPQLVVHGGWYRLRVRRGELSMSSHSPKAQSARRG